MDYVIAVGGRQGATLFNTVQMYHIQEDTWTIKNNFPYSMVSGLGYVIGQSKFFIHGGLTEQAGDIEKHIYEYDFDNDAWIQGVQLPRALKSGFAIVYNQ